MQATDKRILFVDDDLEILDLYAELFYEHGIKIDTARDGIEGLALADANSYDVIITDLNMPRMSGLQLISCIRVSLLNSRTHIIILSGVLDSFEDRLHQFHIAHKLEKVGAMEILPGLVQQILLPKHKQTVGYAASLTRLFKQSTTDLFNFYLNSNEITIAEPVIATSDCISAGVASGIVTIFGYSVYGSVALSLNQAMIKYFAMQLFAKPSEEIEVSEYFELAGELSNQLAGLLKRKFSEHGYHIILGLPQVIIGESHRLPRHTTNPSIRVKASARNGMACAEFCLGDPKKLVPPKPEAGFDLFVYR